ncbi:MAG: P1 family peptidase [Acidobacteriota bacterium]
MDKFEVGKLPIKYLERLLSQIAIKDKRVVVGPGIGKDAAVIDFGDQYLVAKTDPITLTSSKVGWWSVHINANDVACLGATPRWFLATILLPEGKTDQSLAEKIFIEILLVCEELGVTLCGGHTEITQKLEQPIVVGQMLGKVAKRAMLGLARTCSYSSSGSGDYVIAFSAAKEQRIATQAGEKVSPEELTNRRVSPLFMAVVEATEEAVYNSLFKANTMTGRDGYRAEAIPVEKVVELCRKYGVLNWDKTLPPQP